MHDIKSKYKNPDLYIERLKKERDRAWADINRIYKDYLQAQGQEWYAPQNETLSAYLWATQGQMVRINQEVIVRGKVCSIITSTDPETVHVKIKLKRAYIGEEASK